MPKAPQSIFQRLLKMSIEGRPTPEETNAVRLGRLLRLSGERRGKKAPPHHDDERSPLHQAPLIG